MPPAPLLRTARIPESTIPRALCAAGQRRGPVVPASVHRSAAALPGSAVDRARVAPGSESSGPPGKSTRVGASSARGRVSGLRAHTVDWRAARRPPAIPGAPSRVRPESALGSTQCACPSPPRPSRPPTLCRRGSFFLESVVLCAPWVMTSWDASLLAERAFLYGVVTRISTETNTHSDFIVKNEGGAPLVIQRVAMTAPLVVTRMSREVAPGAEGTIHFRLDTANL